MATEDTKTPVTQWSFTSHYEGKISHLYKDTKGKITCGVGFRIQKKDDLDRLMWQPSLAAAYGDYEDIRDLEPGRGMPYYRRHMTARLTIDTMRQEFGRRLDVIRRLLLQDGWNLDVLPVPVRIGLTDMAYNMGVAKLGAKFPKFRAAVEAGDWPAAASESHRLDIAEDRNDATRTLILSAVG